MPEILIAHEEGVEARLLSLSVPDMLATARASSGQEGIERLTRDTVLVMCDTRLADVEMLLDALSEDPYKGVYVVGLGHPDTIRSHDRYNTYLFEPLVADAVFRIYDYFTTDLSHR